MVEGEGGSYSEEQGFSKPWGALTRRAEAALRVGGGKIFLFFFCSEEGADGIRSVSSDDALLLSLFFPLTRTATLSNCLWSRLVDIFLFVPSYHL